MKICVDVKRKAPRLQMRNNLTYVWPWEWLQVSICCGEEPPVFHLTITFVGAAITQDTAAVVLSTTRSEALKGRRAYSTYRSAHLHFDRVQSRDTVCLAPVLATTRAPAATPAPASAPASAPTVWGNHIRFSVLQGGQVGRRISEQCLVLGDRGS